MSATSRDCVQVPEPGADVRTRSGGRERPGTAQPLVLLAVVVVASAALIASGGGVLSPPPLGAPGEWAAWLDRREPVAAAFALLRLGALAGCWYVAVVTALGLVLRAARAARLVALADRFTVSPVRRLLAGTVTAGLVGFGPFGVAAAVAQPSFPAGPAPQGPEVTVVLRQLPATDPSPSPPAAPAPQRGEPPPAKWTVQPGECFWTIAEKVLRQSWGRAPAEVEIAPYWRQLVDANRHALVDGGNADLVFPGQVFEVPPAPGSPGTPAGPLARTG